MHTEIRLKQILDAEGLDSHGRIQRIARETGVNRHTVRKFYNNEACNFSLETVAKICDWLEQRFCTQNLPGALFAARPSALFEALVEPGVVTFHLGEYRAARRHGFARAWVARDDFAVAAHLVEWISQSPATAPVRLRYVHAPSHIASSAEARIDPAKLKKDRQIARRLFDRMRRERGAGSAVLIGSQRANPLVELFVSDLFHARAFGPFDGSVPLFLKYQETERDRSCFGGDVGPDGADSTPGIYFRPKRRARWRHFPSIPRRKGTGVIIVRRDPGLGRLEVAVMGLSGIATAAMGKLLGQMPDQFWPAGPVRAGHEVGIYVCGFDLSGMTSHEQDIDSVTIGPPEIVELQADIRGRRG